MDKNFEFTRKQRATVRKRRATIYGKLMDEASAEKILNEELQSDAEPEEILRRIQLQKDIITSVKSKPWPMKKKILVLKKARDFVEKYEGRLSKGKSYGAIGREAWKKISLYYNEMVATLTPWDNRIKTVESHFGSSVASYFTFLRWLIYINLVIGIMALIFVVLPEAIRGTTAGYKTVPPNKLRKAWDLETLWALGGYLEYSVLFYGFYSSEAIGNGYRLPLAYFLVGIMAFAYSFIALLRKMARNSRLEGNSDSSDDYTFSWKLFCSWDYMIGNTETAENKSAAIATSFRESIVEEQEKEKEKDMRKNVLIFLRVIANVVVMLILAGSLYSIQNAVSRAQAQINNDGEKTFWEQNEVGVVVTLVTLITPSLFEVFGTMEKYHPRNTLRIQLARILMLYLGNLYSLMIGLLNYVTAATEKVNLLGNSTPSYIAESEEYLFNVEPGLARRLTTNITNRIVTILKDTEKLRIESEITKILPDTVNSNSAEVVAKSNVVTKGSTECWETYVGQELLKLTIIDLISTVLTVLIIDFIRGLVVRYFNICCCWDMEQKFPEYGEFKIAENVLHLIYNQGITWIGSFFCPLLPLINVMKLTMLMYLRSWAVVTCNVPHSRVFRASGSNFYLAMLLFMLFLSLLPTMWVIVQCPPSNCGPFRNKERMYFVLSETFEDIPAWMKTVFHHLTTPVVILPAILLLLMVVYYLQAVFRSTNNQNAQLRLQLQYERKEGRRNVFQMGAGAKQKEELKKQASATSNAQVMASCNVTAVYNHSEGIKQTSERQASVSSSSSSNASDTAEYSQHRDSPISPRQKRNTKRENFIRSETSYESPRKNTIDGTPQHTNSASSYISPPRSYNFSRMASVDPYATACDHSHYSPYPPYSPNVMLNQPGLYQAIPRYASTDAVAVSIPQTILIQPTHVPNVPCIVVPASLTSQTSGQQNNDQRGESLVHARFDPVKRTAGSFTRDDVLDRVDENTDSDRSGEGALHRQKNSLGLVRQSNVCQCSSPSPKRKTAESGDTNDDYISDAESSAESITLERMPSCGGGRCSAKNVDSSVSKDVH